MYSLPFQWLHDKTLLSFGFAFDSDHCNVTFSNLFHGKMSWFAIWQPAFLASNLESSLICCEVMYFDIIFAFFFFRSVKCSLAYKCCKQCVLALEIVWWRFFSVVYLAPLHNNFKTYIWSSSVIKLSCPQSHNKVVFMC